MSTDNYWTSNRPTEMTEDSTEVTDAETEDESLGCKLAEWFIDFMFSRVFICTSILLICGLAFSVRRKTRWLHCCWGRPGCLQPVDFVDESERRWAFAACFTILTNDIFSLLIANQSNWNFLPKEDEEWSRKFGWVRVFSKLFEALACCLVYYPLLACIEYRRSIAANVVGFLYVILWIATYVVYFGLCSISYEKRFKGFVHHLHRVPIFIALLVVGFSYILDFVENIRQKIAKRRQRKQKDSEYGEKGNESSLQLNKKLKVEILDPANTTSIYKLSNHLEYVSNLLRRHRDETPVTRTVLPSKCSFIEQKSRNIAKKLKYEKLVGFRYPTRLLCSMSVTVTTVIWLFVAALEKIDGWMAELDENFTSVEIDGNDNLIIKVITYLACALTSLVIFLCLLNTMISYKRRWLQLLHGDHSWHHYGSTIVSPNHTLLSGLKFAGYQVAFAAWGWAVLAACLWGLLMFLTFFIILPLSRGEFDSYFIQLLLKMWPTLLLGILIIPKIQLLICRFVFLQGKESGLALDNIRTYNATSYYFLILNVIVGVFSCLKRILMPFVLGILFLSRLDQPLIMKGYESMDPGHAAFVSMLLVDLYHNNPLVKTFVELLIQVRDRRQAYADENEPDAAVRNEKSRRSMLIRNRWLKAMTLVNNPSLAMAYLEKRLRDELRSKNVKTEVTVDIEMQELPKNDKDDLPAVKDSAPVA